MAADFSAVRRVVARRPVVGGVTRLVFFSTVLLLSACQGSSQDFLQRSQQDCADGDQDACRMLSDLESPRRALPSRTQTQRNVQAILQGMEQARASRTSGAREETPSAAPEPEAPPAAADAP